MDADLLKNEQRIPEAGQQQQGGVVQPGTYPIGQGGYVYTNYPAQIPPGSQVIIVQQPNQLGNPVIGTPVVPPGFWQPVIPERPRIDATLPHEQTQAFCNAHCLSTSFQLAATYIVVLIVLGIIAALFSPALVLLAIAPSVMILAFMEKEYGKAVTKCQMTMTFFEAVFWMIPLSFVLLSYIFYIDAPLGLPETGLCPACLAGYAFQAYFLAGTLEELLKYVTVRRLLHDPSIVDPRAFIVYGCCAAAGFATVENILYVASGNIAVGVARAITAVPLHCAMGIFMGCMLAERKFNNKNNYRWPFIVGPCIVIHGTYDMVIFTTNYGSGEAWAMACGLLAAIIIMVGTYVMLRHMVLKLQRQFPPVDLHAMIDNGAVPVPVQCCASLCPKCCMA
mmetsp:Transcript_28657/g.37558  ORF Transcript_28657/g.37558 Transcript_28657/m.37558 type:complete len:393 (-) Transcript_28657:344-1522(-)